MNTKELDFLNFKPKPGRLRFFIEKSGVKASYDFECDQNESATMFVRSRFQLDGGLLANLVPIQTHAEETQILNQGERTFSRETKLRNGSTRTQSFQWNSPRLPSTAEAPWILEEAWLRLIMEEAPPAEGRFFFCDGRNEFAAVLQDLSKTFSKELMKGTGSAALLVRRTDFDVDAHSPRTDEPRSQATGEIFRAQLVFTEFRLSEFSFSVPVLGPIRLIRRNG